MISTNLPIFALFLLLFSILSLCVSERCHPNDKKALLKLKKDLPFDIITWDPKTDCCEDWFAVRCDYKTNRITHFVILHVNLNLPIPDAVGDLSFLEELKIHVCNATGQIPQAISKLSNLNSLDLSQNLLTGPVPSFLGNLKKLTYIALSRNSLTGSIPASLSQLPKLTGLVLDRNQLTGGIPESFGDLKAKQLYFDFTRNQLSGKIPASVGNADFTLLDVSRNKLEGDISFLFGENKSLRTADFSRNLLQFDISKIEFSNNLRNLELSHNKIFGSLPAAFTKIQFSFFNVSYNRLCGPIPAGGRLQEFDSTTYFHNKCLCGSPLPLCK